MADEEQLRLLKRSVEGWNRRRAESGLSQVDLREADLSFADLRGADFSGAYLSEATFFGAILTGAVFDGAVLASADLTRANLFGANLCRSDLTQANLHQARLSTARMNAAKLVAAHLDEANLVETDLCEADLREANLRATNLTDAKLCRADLSEAILVRTNLHGANLREANLEFVWLGETVFANTDLSGANLHVESYLGPSSLDHRTLERSGKLPDAFLRGCGLPERLIEELRSTIGRATEFYTCFISYSHADKVFVKRLYDRLQERGIRCWKDDHQMKPGDDIDEQIHRAIMRQDKVLLCCSKSSLTSGWVDNELDRAFEKERDLMKERGKNVPVVIPLDIDGYVFSDKCKNVKAQRLSSSRVVAKFSGWENNNDVFEKSFTEVVDALKTDDAGGEPPPESDL